MIDHNWQVRITRCNLRDQVETVEHVEARDARWPLGNLARAEIVLDAAHQGMPDKIEPPGIDDDGFYKGGDRLLGCPVRRTHQHRGFEAVTLQDGFQMIERVTRGKTMVGINPQSEDEIEAAAKTAWSLDQQDLLAAGHIERQVTLGQQVA